MSGLMTKAATAFQARRLSDDAWLQWSITQQCFYLALPLLHISRRLIANMSDQGEVLDYHYTEVDDVLEHDWTPECWCGPEETGLLGEGTKVYRHNTLVPGGSDEPG